MTNQDKSPDAFRTISEVADDLDLPQHVLRFWETRFTQIKPLKRGGGRRYYRPDDVELLRGIRHLLYGEGYTIKGVQRILKEQGPRFVMQIWREDALPVPATQQAVSKPKVVETPPVPQADDAAPQEATPRDVLPETSARKAAEKAPGSMRFMDRFRSEKEAGQAADVPEAMSKDDVRRLQSTLFELLECKRILDQAR
ncbi:MerR family transcriptional regulator [uncultured Roseibium sp.]|uniref:MerR family transcriptional regulator n=1 Tax=uncultured Roseibium sp. TaxID=1936171 RepID=UPI0025957FEA|nr:MerR family transcriptional regulator [uncultured Roseibium sp.]